jgi:hypothetical protein
MNLMRRKKMDKIITVASYRKDDYGNMHIKDSEGNEHKVGSKRSQLFPFIEQSVGHEIKLKYKEYQGKEYIAEVEPANAPAVVKEAIKQGAVIVEDKMTKEDWKEKDRLERQSIHRQKASDIGTRWCSTIIGTGTPVSTKQMMDVVKMLEHYYETGE